MFDLVTLLLLVKARHMLQRFLQLRYSQIRMAKLTCIMLRAYRAVLYECEMGEAVPCCAVLAEYANNMQMCHSQTVVSLLNTVFSYYKV